MQSGLELFFSFNECIYEGCLRAAVERASYRFNSFHWRPISRLWLVSHDWLFIY